MYKKYQDPNAEVDRVLEHHMYRQQLATLLNCPAGDAPTVSKLDYKENAIAQAFRNYYACRQQAVPTLATRFRPPVAATATPATTLPGKRKRSWFRDHVSLQLGARVQYSEFTATNPGDRDIKFRGQSSFSPYAELELTVLPNGRGAVYGGLFRQHFNREAPQSLLIGTVDYKSLEVPFGLRYYLSRPTANSRFFVDAGYQAGFAADSPIWLRTRGEATVENAGNFTVGLGYRDRTGLSASVGHQFNRNFVGGSGGWRSEFGGVSLTVGFWLLWWVFVVRGGIGSVAVLTEGRRVIDCPRSVTPRNLPV